MESGVSLLIGTRNAALRPASARGFGVEIDVAGFAATVFLPASAAALTLSNLRDNGQIALTFSRGFDHRSLQVKGHILSISETNERQRHLQDRYFAAFSAGLLLISHRENSLRHVRYYPSYALSFRIESMFDQTPGPGAGRARLVAS
jgi:hypothetical protein